MGEVVPGASISQVFLKVWSSTGSKISGISYLSLDIIQSPVTHIRTSASSFSMNIYAL